MLSSTALVASRKRDKQQRQEQWEEVTLKIAHAKERLLEATQQQPQDDHDRLILLKELSDTVLPCLLKELRSLSMCASSSSWLSHQAQEELAVVGWLQFLVRYAQSHRCFPESLVPSYKQVPFLYDFVLKGDVLEQLLLPFTPQVCVEWMDSLLCATRRQRRPRKRFRRTPLTTSQSNWSPTLVCVLGLWACRSSASRQQQQQQDDNEAVPVLEFQSIQETLTEWTTACFPPDVVSPNGLTAGLVLLGLTLLQSNSSCSEDRLVLKFQGAHVEIQNLPPTLVLEWLQTQNVLPLLESTLRVGRNELVARVSDVLLQYGYHHEDATTLKGELLQFTHTAFRHSVEYRLQQLDKSATSTSPTALVKRNPPGAARDPSRKRPRSTEGSSLSRPPDEGIHDDDGAFGFLVRLQVLLWNDKVSQAIYLAHQLEVCRGMEEDDKAKAWHYVLDYLLFTGNIFLDGNQVDSTAYQDKRKQLLQVRTHMGNLGMSVLAEFYQELANAAAEEGSSLSAKESQYVQRASQQTLLRLLIHRYGSHPGIVKFFEAFPSLQSWGGDGPTWAISFLTTLYPIPPSLLDSQGVLNLDGIWSRPSKEDTAAMAGAPEQQEEAVATAAIAATDEREKQDEAVATAAITAAADEREKEEEPEPTAVITTASDEREKEDEAVAAAVITTAIADEREQQEEPEPTAAFTTAGDREKLEPEQALLEEEQEQVSVLNVSSKDVAEAKENRHDGDETADEDDVAALFAPEDKEKPREPVLEVVDEDEEHEEIMVDSAPEDQDDMEHVLSDGQEEASRRSSDEGDSEIEDDSEVEVVAIDSSSSEGAHAEEMEKYSEEDQSDVHDHEESDVEEEEAVVEILSSEEEEREEPFQQEDVYKESSAVCDTDRLERGYEPDTTGQTEEEVSEAVHTEEEEEPVAGRRHMFRTEDFQPVARVMRPAPCHPSFSDMDAADDRTVPSEEEHTADLSGFHPRGAISRPRTAIESSTSSTLLDFALIAQQRTQPHERETANEEPASRSGRRVEINPEVVYAHFDDSRGTAVVPAESVLPQAESSPSQGGIRVVNQVPPVPLFEVGEDTSAAVVASDAERYLSEAAASQEDRPECEETRIVDNVPEVEYAHVGGDQTSAAHCASEAENYLSEANTEGLSQLGEAAGSQDDNDVRIIDKLPEVEYANQDGDQTSAARAASEAENYLSEANTEEVNSQLGESTVEEKTTIANKTESTGGDDRAGYDADVEEKVKPPTFKIIPPSRKEEKTGYDADIEEKSSTIADKELFPLSDTGDKVTSPIQVDVSDERSVGLEETVRSGTADEETVGLSMQVQADEGSRQKLDSQLVAEKTTISSMPPPAPVAMALTKPTTFEDNVPEEVIIAGDEHVGTKDANADAATENTAEAKAAEVIIEAGSQGADTRSHDDEEMARSNDEMEEDTQSRDATVYFEDTETKHLEDRGPAEDSGSQEAIENNLSPERGFPVDQTTMYDSHTEEVAKHSGSEAEEMPSKEASSPTVVEDSGSPVDETAQKETSEKASTAEPGSPTIGTRSHNPSQDDAEEEVEEDIPAVHTRSHDTNAKDAAQDDAEVEEVGVEDNVPEEEENALQESSDTETEDAAEDDAEVEEVKVEDNAPQEEEKSSSEEKMSPAEVGSPATHTRSHDASAEDAAEDDVEVEEVVDEDNAAQEEEKALQESSEKVSTAEVGSPAAHTRSHDTEIEDAAQDDDEAEEVVVEDNAPQEEEKALQESSEKASTAEVGSPALHTRSHDAGTGDAGQDVDNVSLEEDTALEESSEKASKAEVGSPALQTRSHDAKTEDDAEMEEGAEDRGSPAEEMAPKETSEEMSTAEVGSPAAHTRSHDVGTDDDEKAESKVTASSSTRQSARVKKRQATSENSVASTRSRRRSARHDEDASDDLTPKVGSQEGSRSTRARRTRSTKDGKDSTPLGKSISVAEDVESGDESVSTIGSTRSVRATRSRARSSKASGLTPVQEDEPRDSLDTLSSLDTSTGASRTSRRKRQVKSAASLPAVAEEDGEVSVASSTQSNAKAGKKEPSKKRKAPSRKKAEPTQESPPKRATRSRRKIAEEPESPQESPPKRATRTRGKKGEDPESPQESRPKRTTRARGKKEQEPESPQESRPKRATRTRSKKEEKEPEPIERPRGARTRKKPEEDDASSVATRSSARIRNKKK